MWRVSHARLGQDLHALIILFGDLKRFQHQIPKLKWHLWASSLPVSSRPEVGQEAVEFSREGFRLLAEFPNGGFYFLG